MEFGGSNPTLFVKTIWYVQFGLFCSILLADFLGYKKLVYLLVFLFGGCVASLWYYGIITYFSFVGLLEKVSTNPFKDKKYMILTVNMPTTSYKEARVCVCGYSTFNPGNWCDPI
jgi:hypothetical protein